MLKALPINLNKQAQDATILLIREVIESGIELSEVRHRGSETLRPIHIPELRFMLTHWARRRHGNNSSLRRFQEYHSL